VIEEVRAGIWKHYKGQHYLVIGGGHDANADALYDDPHQRDPEPLGEREVVVYIPLEMDGAHTGFRMAVRTLSDFNALVCVLDACPNYGGTETGPYDACVRCKEAMRPRFAYVGERWEGR
jgi:hypothetical protein